MVRKPANGALIDVDKLINSRTSKDELTSSGSLRAESKNHSQLKKQSGVIGNDIPERNHFRGLH